MFWAKSKKSSQIVWCSQFFLLFQLQHIPENVIVETTEYKCLQSQFSVLYNESLQMKTQLDEARNLAQSNKNTHLRQIEQMEVSLSTYIVGWGWGSKTLFFVKQFIDQEATLGHDIIWKQHIYKVEDIWASQGQIQNFLTEASN